MRSGRNGLAGMLSARTVYVAPAAGLSRPRANNRVGLWAFPVAVTIVSSTLAVATSSATDVDDGHGSTGSGDDGGGLGGLNDVASEVRAAPGQIIRGGADAVAEAFAMDDGDGTNAQSMLDSLLASINAILEDYGYIPSATLCTAIAVAIVTLVFINKFANLGSGMGSGSSGSRVRGAKSAKQRKGVVLLIGPCGSGKTALSHRLCHDRLAPTVTSMQACTYSCERVLQAGAKRSVAPVIIDYPGHDRLRGGLGEELRKADRVIFILDGSCLMAQVAAGAELLYDVLTDRAVEGCRGLLVALNKSDVKEAKISRAKLLIQKELEKLRGTRDTLGTQGEEDNLPTAMMLGRPGQPFNLEVDSPCEIAFISCSVVQEGGLEALAEFVGDSVR